MRLKVKELRDKALASRNRFIKILLICFPVLSAIIIFHEITGWRKGYSVDPLPFKEALISFAIDGKLIYCLFISFLVAYFTSYGKKGS